MKVSLSWLKDYVKFNIPAEKLAHQLTMAGLEVEKIYSAEGDAVLELEITPNRPDCLSVLGIAREVSAILNKTLKTPKGRKRKLPSAKADISILDREGCPRYIGTLIKNVNVGKTPEVISKRLAAVGSRSINNIVDITNFCLLELGQPMHAFDYDKLIGGKIVVRRAKRGEKITTLDGIERVLDPSILIIADAKRPVAVAGVMGGGETEVTAETKNILLESAYFDPVLVRRGARQLGLSTDSSYRFERGVNIEMVEGGAQRAIAMIREMAGGDVVKWKDLFITKRKISYPHISIDMQKINSLLGARLTYSQCKTILKRLEFDVKGQNRSTLQVQPPPFRGDIKRGVDIIEELARVIGYDNLPMSLPSITLSHIQPQNKRELKKELRNILCAQGFNEAITYALTSKPFLEKTRLDIDKNIKIRNPLSQDQEIMRPDLLPSLLSIVRSNLNRGQKSLRLFELGKKYTTSGEEEVLALIMTGLRPADWRHFRRDKYDFFDIKGPVSAVLEGLKIRDVHFTLLGPTAIVEPGWAMSVTVGKKTVGILGKVKKEILTDWDIKQEDVYFAQIGLKDFEQKRGMSKEYRPVCEYPAIIRDVSLAVKPEVTFEQIKNIAWQYGSKYLKEIHFIELYRGEKMPKGHHGLIFSLLYQSSKRTLTEEEINAVHSDVCQNFVEQLQAIIR